MPYEAPPPRGFVLSVAGIGVEVGMRGELELRYDERDAPCMNRPAAWERFRLAADRLVEDARRILQGALPDSVATAFWLKALALLHMAGGGEIALSDVVAPFCKRRMRMGELEHLRAEYLQASEWDPDPDDPERIFLLALILDAELRYPNRKFQLYAPAALLEAFEHSVPGSSTDAGDVFLRLAAALAEKGYRRDLAQLPSDDALSALASEMPNFGEVVSFYSGQAALARLGESDVAHFPPVLLLGPPGIGKTRFSERFAEALLSVCRRISLASASAGWIITGLDRSWATAKPGEVLLTLANSPMANAIILIDELDKAHVETRYNPLGGFYALLEAETARLFTDECLSFPVDASALIWIATANDVGAIPEPIRSRLTIFNIGPPSGTLARQIVYRVFKQVTGGKRFAPIDEVVVDLLVELPPRELHASLRAAAGAAAQRAIANGDEWARILPNDIVVPQGPRAMGFI